MGFMAASRNWKGLCISVQKARALPAEVLR